MRITKELRIKAAIKALDKLRRSFSNPGMKRKSDIAKEIDITLRILRADGKFLRNNPSLFDIKE